MSYESLFTDFLAENYNNVIKQCNQLLRNLPISETRKRRILLNNRAAAYLKMGFNRKAIKDAKAANDIDEFWLRPVYIHIQALVKSKKIEKAVEVYEEWLEEEDTIDCALQKEIELYLEKEKNISEIREREEEEKLKKEKIERRKKRAAEKKARIEEEARLRKLKKAELKRNEVTKFQFCEMLVKQGNVKKAIEEYGKLIKANPDCWDAYWKRGALYYQMRKWGKCVKDWNNCCLRENTNIKTLMKLAEARNLYSDYLLTKPKREAERKNELDLAVAHVTRAHKILRQTDQISKIFECLRMRAFFFRKLGNLEYALHDFQDAIKLLPTNVECMTAMGLTLSELGRSQEAVRIYMETLLQAKKKEEAIVNHNLGLSYTNLGDAKEAEKYFSQAIKGGHDQTYNVRAMCRYYCGDIHRAIKDFNRAGETLDSRDIQQQQLKLQMRGVSYQSIGQFRWAEKDYSKLMLTRPQFPILLSWFRLQMIPKLQTLLDKPFTEYNYDKEFDGHFKVSYVHNRNPKMIPKYKPNNGKIKPNIPDVNCKDELTREQEQLREGTQKFGFLLQCTDKGFLPNKRQHRMFGLALLEVVQTLKQHMENPITVNRHQSSFSRRSHKFGWRDMVDIAVRWRQLSEPFDQIFWNDVLAHDNQNGQQASLLSGQKKSEKYHIFFDRAFDMVKKLACEQLPNQSDFDKGLMMEAKNLETLHDNVGGDFVVKTSVESEEDGEIPGVRFLLMVKQPAGFDFTVHWPLDGDRQVAYEEQFEKLWEKVVELKKDGSNLEECVAICLTFYYYWGHYGGLTKGNASVGLIVLHSLLIITGFTIARQIPLQLDWECLFCKTPAQFIEKVRAEMDIVPLSEDKEDSPWNDLPQVSKHVTNLRELIHILNYKE